MEILGFALLAIGVLISLIYGIQLIILAFRTSVLWGLGYIFLSFPVALIFIFMHWSQTKRPFLMSLLAVPFYIGAAVILAQQQTFTMEALPTAP